MGETRTRYYCEHNSKVGIDCKILMIEYIDLEAIREVEQGEPKDILNSLVVRLIIDNNTSYDLVVDYKGEADFYNIRLIPLGTNTPVYEEDFDSTGARCSDRLNDLKEVFQDKYQAIYDCITDVLFEYADDHEEMIAHRGLVNQF